MTSKIVLSEKEVALRLEKFEFESQVLSLEINNVSVWQILRQSVAAKLQNLSINKNSIERKNFANACLRGLRVWKLLKLRGRKYIAFTYYSGTRLKEKDKFEDVWFDVLLDEIPGGAKITQMNAVGFEDKLKKSRIPPDYDMTLLVFMASLLAKYFPIQPGNLTYQHIAGLVREKFELNEVSVKSIQKSFSHFVWMSRLQTLILKIVKTKYCIVVDTGEFSLLYACKKQKVKFIELQHGIFTKNHPHVYPDSTIKSSLHLLLPDIIGVYGDYWKNELIGTVQSSQNLVRTVGNGLLERFQKLKLRQSKSQSFLVVLTTQGLDRENLINFLIEFLRTNKKNLKLIIKLHPAYDSDKSYYSKLCSVDSRVEVVSGAEEPNTYELLARADLHLSIASACHYDALSIGTPTGVIKLQGYELMYPLIEGGYATLLSTAMELSDYVDNQISGNLKHANSHIFCQSGYRLSMSELLV